MTVRRSAQAWLGIAASLVAHFACPAPTWGASISWTNGAGGSWSDPDNWDSGVPGPSDTANITLDGTYAVTLDANASVASLALGAASGTQTLSAVGRTLTLGGASVVSANGLLSMSTSTVSGPGLLTNAGTIALNSSSMNAPMNNDGLVRAAGTASLNGAVTTSAGSTLRVESSGGTTTMTVANGFTNNGTIEMTATSGGNPFVLLSVTNGTLVNAPDGVINVLPGVGGGIRTLTAQLDNQGMLFLGTALTVNKASADHVNNGTIDVAGGNLTLSQGGTTPTFTNSGLFSIGSGRTATISSGPAVNAGSAILRGRGTLIVSTSAFTNAGIIEPGASPGVLTITGSAPMTATSVLTLELGGYAPGTEFDRLAVSGTVALAGALDVALVNGFVPALGDSFVVLTAGSLSGAFSCLRGTEIGGGLAIKPVIQGATLTLAVVNSTSVNSPPDAMDDDAATTFDAPVVVPVLANDSDAEGDSIILRSIDLAGASGSAVVNAGGQSITYTPLFFFMGEDTLRYTIGDCHGGIDVALVVVSVGPVTGVEHPYEPMSPVNALSFTTRLKPGGGVAFALDLPLEADVEIDLFDVQGRRVDRIVERHLPTGRHELAWEGAGLASGIYFARLLARSATEEIQRTARVLRIR